MRRAVCRKLIHASILSPARSTSNGCDRASPVDGAEEVLEDVGTGATILVADLTEARSPKPEARSPEPEARSPTGQGGWRAENDRRSRRGVVLRDATGQRDEE